MAMAEPKLRDQLIQRRLERMRLGQSACKILRLPSDQEFEVALVPLSEEEYDQALAHAAAIEDVSDTTFGNQFIDRRSQQEILVFALRMPNKLEERVFENANQLRVAFDSLDINYLIDSYLELAEEVSPSITELTEEELEELKKVLIGISWSDLTGGQWYALSRFLSTLSPEQLLGKLPGSFLINQ